MPSLAWVPRVCVLAVSLLISCDQPTGLVVSVHGAESAQQLWLTVGATRVSTNQPRFVQSEETSRIQHDGPYSDGFEIYLDRAGLREQAEVALVLDSVVDGGALDILRDTYVVAPKTDVLVEVRLTPRALGRGQWVCPGRARSDQDPDGFAVALDAKDLDCDRDGWLVDADPDDADPLATGVPRLLSVRDGAEQRCAIALGDNPVRIFPDGAVCGTCNLPTMPSEVNNCLATAPRTICKTRAAEATFTVKDLVGSKPENPNWALAKVWPSAAAVSGTFVPSDLAPNEWSVLFSVAPGALVTSAWFVLTDRAAGTSTLINVEFGDGGDDECKMN